MLQNPVQLGFAERDEVGNARNQRRVLIPRKPFRDGRYEVGTFDKVGCCRG
jgi:hypothetical protein